LDFGRSSRAQDNGEKEDASIENCQEVEANGRRDAAKGVQYWIVARFPFLTLPAQNFFLFYYRRWSMLLHWPALVSWSDLTPRCLQCVAVFAVRGGVCGAEASRYSGRDRADGSRGNNILRRVRRRQRRATATGA
jgi:hypothetical protein